MSDQHISPKELRRRFSYHRNGWLIRKVRTAPNTFIGQIVKGHSQGKRDKYKYLFIRIKNKRYKIAFHRAVFAVVNGRYPKKILDHVNRDASDNRITNLREATISQNGFNQKLSKRNKSGYRCIQWVATRQRWRLIICANGKYHYIGTYKNLATAIVKQKESLKRLHGTFAVV